MGRKRNPGELAGDEVEWRLWVTGMLNRHEGMLKVLIPLVLAVLTLIVGLYFKA
ncbi:MAG: hypothetical protein QMD10_10920 [Desulfitobacteriaceae bacterium]|nr:hypothetical protein [Desulfitobacteriaceae bacterium]